MPSFISGPHKDKKLPLGIWEAAHERSPYTDKDGQPQIYDGPDRAALKYIQENGGTVGQDATKDPQIIQASRNMGFNSVEEYLKNFAPTEKQLESTKEENSKQVVTHAPNVAKEGVEPSLGGFFDPTANETPDSVMEAKKQRGRPKRS